MRLYKNYRFKLMLFEEYLNKNSFPEWKDKYINYGQLKQHVNNIINKKINAEKIFLVNNILKLVKNIYR